MAQRAQLTVGWTAAALLAAGSALGADWAQWRGPRRDGAAPGFQAPARWPEKLARKWRVQVGEGHASPLIAGGSAYVFTREGENEVARKLDLATGKQVWSAAYAAPYEMHEAARGHGKGPKSTPAYADGRLYTLGISGVLSCLDTRDGRVVWRKSFGDRFKSTSPLYGTAASPLVENGLVYAGVGGHDDGAFAAFNAATGAVRWEWREDGPGYASPVLFSRDGVRMVVTQSQKACVGLDAATGKLLWKVPFTTPYDQNSVTPLVLDDRIVFGGTRQPTFALRISKGGGGWSAQRAWETTEATLYISSPVFAGGRIYGMSERRQGQLFALDAATGRTVWTGEARFGDNAAVLDAGSVLLVLDTDAELHVLRKDAAGLVPVARFQVADSPTWASPALADRHLLVKDQNSLALWELPR